MLNSFHPAVAAWFRSAYDAPTDCQVKAWPAIQRGRDTLIAAPTGSGKTLAAFLAVIDDLAREGEVFGLPDETRVVYISPLKALSNDIHKNLEAPLQGINHNLFELGLLPVAIRAQVRTGDTPAVMRAAMVRQPPHILVTTPESLYILLTSDSGRRMLKSIRTVIVDEIHALVATKRGAHLALSLERLNHLVGQRVIRIGLSATQKPIDEIGRFLTGGSGDCELIDHGHRRPLDLAIELPQLPLDSVLSHQACAEIYDRMASLIQLHRTTLIFVNTRRLAERVAFALTERLGEIQVTSHHGSLSREQRLSAEDRLKAGQLRALVATASLELGIDVGEVDLVCQLGSTGSIATLLQRVGRSGHTASGYPKGRLFPTTRDDLLECIALIQAVRRGELERLTVCMKPLDVLAQQIVAMVAAEDWTEEQLFRCVGRAYPFRDLTRSEFDQLVCMLAEGYGTQRGVRGAYLHRDGIYKRLGARRGARLTAVTCGGAIPDQAEYGVLLEPGGELLGTVDEHFAVECVIGDVFQLANKGWRVLGLDGANLRVADAQGQPPSVPFWFGEAPGRSYELSEALSRLRCEMAASLEAAELEEVARSLEQHDGIPAAAAEQAVRYLGSSKDALGVLPTLDCIVFERFFDESEGMQLIIHAPFGSRINRAWGLALRKRFCRTFNFELQAAANENAVILSLGTSQSFALEDVQHFLKPETARNLLVQALLAAPMFIVRWRWNAVCALAVRRFQNGRKTRPHLIRMQAEDLVTSVFPDQLACLENIVGDREIPDHPLVQQTILDCLTEAMDVDRFLGVLVAIQSGAMRVVCRDVIEPSPLAAEIVNARVYSYLDGAGLEERRTRAVSLRRGFDSRSLVEAGMVDSAAVETVRGEAWPDVGSVEELHDALQLSGFFIEPSEIKDPWSVLFGDLLRQQRATRLALTAHRILWVAAERWPQVRAVFPGLPGDPPLALPSEYDLQQWSREDALVSLLRARLAVLGPVSEDRLAEQLSVSAIEIRAALLRLESEGFILKGCYSEPQRGDEWCERRLAARISKYSRALRRREIEPVPVAQFINFLFHWQHLHPETRMQGPQALGAILTQLEGFEASADAWERALLPGRIKNYVSDDLDHLCRSGQFAWLRLRPSKPAQAPVRSTPVVFLPRRSLGRWTGFVDAADMVSAEAERVEEVLRFHGALFFDEIAEQTGFSAENLREALAELTVRGSVTSDAFAGFRALLVPPSRKPRGSGSGCGLESAGRWSIVGPRPGSRSEVSADDLFDHAVRALLRRYGILFRNLLAREDHAPPWPVAVRVCRRLEARGEIRGGRFVAGRLGEQFALPDVAEMLRAVGAIHDSAEIWISAADPLNLVGIVLSGARIPAGSGCRILFRGGLPIALDDGKGGVQTVTDSTASEASSVCNLPGAGSRRAPESLRPGP